MTVPAGWTPCTADTARCEFWTWGAVYERPACCTEHLKELLFFTGDLLTRHGITHWIDWGTLLGAVRNGAFIPWDSDVDFGILAADRDRIRALGPEIAAAGYRFDASGRSSWRIWRSEHNLQHADLFFWSEDAEQLKCEMPGEPASLCVFPRRFIESLKPVSLCGRAFAAPRDVAAFLTAHRYGPDYMTPRRPDAEEQRRAVVGKLQRFMVQRRQAAQLERDLVLLHDVLAGTALRDRYWVFGGLLLGWGREGRILPHDANDADFALLRDDEAALLDAAPLLAAAGFEPRFCYRDNCDVPWEYTFTKGAAKYDFFLCEAAGAEVNFKFFGNLRGRPVESISRLPAHHPLAPFEFLGRTWRKPGDHEAYFVAAFGDWRVPRPDYDYKTDDPSIIEVRTWTGSHEWHVAREVCS